jgi:glycosyltransferase involved in cell wall biosynthesis
VRLLLDVSAIPSPPLGAGVYAVNLVRALGELQPGDLDLHVLTRKGDRDRWAALAPTATVHAEVPGPRPVRLAWEQVRAGRLAERLGIDVWHGPHYTLPLRLPCPAVVTVHDLTFFDHPEWHERSKVAFFRPMTKAAVAQAEVVVAVSGATARRLGEVLAPEAQVVTIPHGVDHDRFTPAHDPRGNGQGQAADLAALTGLGVRPPYIAFVGTMEPRKAIPTLVEAFARLAPSFPNLRLVLAGKDGWGTEAVRAAVAASGVATRILRVRWVPDEALPALFRWAEAVAYPSFEEGFGLPALEALACGAALVTTEGSPMAEFAGDAAVVVPPGDVIELAAALERLLTDEVLRARLRRVAPEAAGAHQWEASAKRHLWAYRLAAAETGTRIAAGQVSERSS